MRTTWNGSLTKGRRLAAMLAAAILVTGGLWAMGASAPADPTAHAARTLRATEHVQLRLEKKSGSRFSHSGRATGTVAGRVRSRTTLNALSLRGVVVITTRHGKLNMRVRGTARSGGLRSRFEGTARMDGGTGRYAHAHGRGTFSGIVNRRTWAATIDATGTLTY